MRLITVEPLAFLFILTVYCEYTAVQDMISTKLCFQFLNSTSDGTCDKNTLSPDQRKELSAQLASQMMCYMGIFSFTAIIASLFTGSWSDTLGRKPQLMLPSALGLIAELLFAFTSAFLTRDYILVLVFIAAGFNGISGGTTTVMSSCFGYISDVSNTQSRTRRITLLESAFFVGGFIGYNTAGQMIRHVVGHKYEYIFGLCFVLHLIIIGYTLTLAETRGPRRCASLPVDNSISQDKQKILSLVHVKQMFRTAFRRREGRKRVNLFLLFTSGFISFIAMSVQMTLFFTYVKSDPFDWDPSRYSLYSGLNFLVNGIFLMAFIPIIYRIWPSLPDAVLAQMGFLSKFAYLLNIGLSQSATQIFAGIVLSIFSEYTMPSIRSMISKTVNEEERGKAFAFSGVLQNICQFIGSIIFPALYSVSLSLFPGLVFIIAALTQLVAMLLIRSVFMAVESSE